MLGQSPMATFNQLIGSGKFGSCKKVPLKMQHLLATIRNYFKISSISQGNYDGKLIGNHAWCVEFCHSVNFIIL